MKAARIDANQPVIVEALRKAGVSVQSTAGIGKGFPDLVCAKGNQVWIIEIKTATGKLTPDQIEFIAAWRGVVHIARSVDDALRIVGVIK